MKIQNYDFGKNWETVIVPLLDRKDVQKAIKKGVNEYLSNNGTSKIRYKQKTIPASYSSKDGYSLLMNIYEVIIYNREMGASISKGCTLSQAKLRKIKHYLTPEVQNKQLQSYVLSGGYHWWNPTFGLTLAKLIFPNEKWIIESTDKHTTIINNKHTLVFDIIYWASCGNRLENYLFGDKVTEEDNSLGGLQAFMDAECF
jgi:hypothetical protein